jgi:hypothetical protein
VIAAMSVYLGTKVCCGGSYWHLKSPSLLISVDVTPLHLSQASLLVVAALLSLKKYKEFITCVWVRNCNWKPMKDSFPCSQKINSRRGSSFVVIKNNFPYEYT